MRKLYLHFAILFSLVWLAIPTMTAAQAVDQVTVHAVFFYSPTCSHCHYVIDEVLEPMMNDYGDQLQIAGIDTTQPGGGQIYQATIEHYQIPQQRRGVPTMIIGDVVLVGSGEIPEQFPSLVEKGLAADGIDWPDIPGFDQILPPEAEPTPTSTSITQTSQITATPTLAAITSATSTFTPPPTPTAAALMLGDGTLPPAIESETFSPDPAGFIIAGLVFIGLLIVVGYTTWRVTITWPQPFNPNHAPLTYSKSWAIPALLLLGLGIALYLAYVEITHVEAICGPIGQCQLVQSSPYAQILGIPVAVLGVLNYLAIGLLWVGHKYRNDQLANLSALGLLGLTFLGTLFSIYLTYLELFVIHAVCAWCLSSAVIIALLMVLIVKPVGSNLSQTVPQNM